MRLSLLYVVSLLTLGACPVWAGSMSETGHGNPVSGPLRITTSPRGACGQCHLDESAGQKFAKGLWRENDNGLCTSCHAAVNFSGVFPGPEVYENSRHRTDPLFVWPGPSPAPRRESSAAGKCVNCHTPHGRTDRSGVIPSLLIAREETLCLTCHDGSPSGKDIARDSNKPYSHPLRYNQGKHRPDEGGDPTRYSYIGGGRHAECSDCHNPHAVADDPMRPTPPTASNRNLRVGRVRVINGAPGSIPQYEYRTAFDTSTPVLEYEICFKCHSTWTRQPPGQQDMATLFNTNNASYHPVEAQGKSLRIDPFSFVPGTVNAFSTIFCSDCHGSDDVSLRGPHGSLFPNILRRSYDTGSSSRLMTQDELCFLCHKFDSYANPAGRDLGFSRFNPPSQPNGHAYHVGQKNVPCYSCHDSHGSPLYPALITTRRSPGLTGFSVTPGGGSCSSTCHGPQSYLTNYPR